MPIKKLKVRGFEVCRGWEGRDVKLPERSTAHAAGYDFFAVEDTKIPAGGVVVMVPTGVKSFMRQSEFLMLVNRSSNPIKKGLKLSNGVGVVDHDFASSEETDGHICFLFENSTSSPVTIKKGDKIGQGIFMTYLLADGDNVTTKRKGGFGSTGE